MQYWPMARITSYNVCYTKLLRVLTHSLDWAPFEADITGALCTSGENELLIGVLSPKLSAPWTDRPVGWSWYADSFSGITYPIHLLLRPDVYIADVFIKPSIV